MGVLVVLAERVHLDPAFPDVLYFPNHLGLHVFLVVELVLCV